jgi:HPt (histidine-containing phosphotransfer) domain-containing protein
MGERHKDSVSSSDFGGSVRAIGKHPIPAPQSVRAESAQKDIIRVRANPLVADLIPEFLLNRRQDVEVMLGALDTGDFEIVARLGHGMKGAGGSWGFQAITDMGGALELAAHSADTDMSRKCVGELSRYLDRVEIVYD